MNDDSVHGIDTDDRLPAPETDGELQERLHDLEGSVMAGEWEGVTYTEAMRAVLKRYALGEIGWGQLGREIGGHG